MRLSVGIKLGFWLALLGILSTGLTGYYAYSQSRAMLIESSKDKLLTATRVLAHRLVYSMGTVSGDALFLARLPSLRQLDGSRADAHAWEMRRRQVEDVMRSLLEAHPEYFQIRLIGVADHGRELVRVDKDHAGVTAVADAELQEKAHFPYFFKTLGLPPGAMYFSSINLNRERGAHLGYGRPTLRIATPVRGGDGSVFGVIVINVDLNGMFDLIRTDVPGDIRVVLTNQEGDYLVHPVAARTFGFDKGIRYRVQEEIEALAPLLAPGAKDHLVLETAGLETMEQPSAAAFVRVPLGASSEERFVLVGLLTPLESVLKESRILGMSIIQITLLFSVLAVAISLLLARLLAKPLDAMAMAAYRFAAGEPMTGLPVGRNDEIGYLASSFQSMAHRLNERVGELQERQQHLGHLAYHDQLTGLPNRILFLDRLQQTIFKAQRHHVRFAVIFIDLDRFKEINDSLGHAVGDVVLKVAAARMGECIRHADTLARLAGDEFTVLLEDLATPQDAARIAQKIIACFDQPVPVGPHQLSLTCSLGISIFPRDGSEAETLLNHADAAMYQAKEEGRNTYRFYAAQGAGVAGAAGPGKGLEHSDDAL